MAIPIWVILSPGIVIYNDHLYNTLKYRDPVSLITFRHGFVVSSG